MALTTRHILCFLPLLATICGCATQKTGPSPTQFVPYEKFETMYYQMSADGKKAYLFFSEPDVLLVGIRNRQSQAQSISGGPVAEGPPTVSINFVGLPDNEENRKTFGPMPIGLIAKRSGHLWVREFDAGDPKGGVNGQQFEMYYAAPGDHMAHRIPCTGVVRESDVPEKTPAAVPRKPMRPDGAGSKAR